MPTVPTVPTVPTNAEAGSCPALGMQQLIRRDQQALACPYPIFASMRSEAPVSYCEELGAWVVLSYADVRAVLHDNEHFSSSMPTGPRARGAQLAAALRALATEPEMAPLLAALGGSGSGAQVLLNADPPLHRRQRVAVNGAFRPSRLRALEPTIAAVANRLLAALVADTGNDPGPGAGQSVDIVSSFAVGLPLQLIAYALGWPTKTWPPSNGGRTIWSCPSATTPPRWTRFVTTSVPPWTSPTTSGLWPCSDANSPAPT